MGLLVTAIVQQINSGVESLRIPETDKGNRFPADCHTAWMGGKSFQQIAGFKAGTIWVGLPARTGRERRSRNAVIRIAHTNRGIVCRVIPCARMLKMVTIKLIAPSREDIPARCRLKIPKSTAGPEWASIPLRGG